MPELFSIKKSDFPWTKYSVVLVGSWITQTRPAMRKTQYPYNVNWIQLVGGLFDEGTNNKGTAGARLQLIYNLYCVASVGAFISWRHAD
jgi:hypothetical protein